MKVLFVCTSNVLRSQMAAALYGSGADSAGFSVSNPGEQIKDKSDAANDMIRFVQEITGKDLSHNVRTLVTPELVEQYDKVVVLETKNIPEFLQNNPKVTIWDIENPNGYDIEGYRKVVDTLREKIIALRSELNNEHVHEQKVR